MLVLRAAFSWRAMVMVFVTAALLAITSIAQAQTTRLRCSPFPTSVSEIPKAWVNPKPEDGDLAVNFPAVPVIFRAFDLGTKSAFDGQNFRMGASQPRLFETAIRSRIASALPDQQLVMMKYELSLGQFVYLTDPDSPFDVLEELAAEGKSARLQKQIDLLAASDNARCRRQMSRTLETMMAEPVTHLGWSDVHDLISGLNNQCFADEACLNSLEALAKSTNRTFLRMPLEHEWEFLARRGPQLAQGAITEFDFRADVPALPAGQLADYALLGGLTEPRPIGSGFPIDGLFDMMGNVSELMGAPFTSELNFGAVGGLVARGGSYASDLNEYRISQRTELVPYVIQNNKTEPARFPLSGLRLILGHTLSADQTADHQAALQASFQSDFQPLSAESELGGNSAAEATSLGIALSRGLNLQESLTETQVADFYSISMPTRADLELNLRGNLPTTIEIMDEFETLLRTQEFRSNGDQEPQTVRLDVGTYLLKVMADSDNIQALTAQGETASYALDLTRKDLRDTGQPSIEHALRLTKKNIPILPEKRDGEDPIDGYVGPGDLEDSYAYRRVSNQAPVAEISVLTGSIRASAYDLEGTLIGRLDLSAGDVKELFWSKPQSRGAFYFKITSTAAEGARYKLVPYSINMLDASSRASIARADIIPRPRTPLQTFKLGFNAPLSQRFLNLVMREPHRIELGEGFADRVSLSILRTDGSRLFSHEPGTASNASFDIAAGTYLLEMTHTDPLVAEATPVSFLFGAVPEDFLLSRQDARATRTINRLHLQGDEKTIYGHSYLKLTSPKRGTAYNWNIRISPRKNPDLSDLSLISMVIEDDTGRVLARSTNSASGDIILRHTQPALAQNYLRLTFDNGRRQGTINYTASRTRILGSITEEHWGPVISTHKDWTVHKEIQPTGETFCSAITEAKTYKPKTAGWTVGVPYMHFTQIDRDFDMQIALMNINKRPNTFKGEVKVGGTWRILPDFGYSRRKFIADSSFDQVSISALKLLTRGTAFRVNGILSDGSPFESEFSLLGYTSANTAANKLCGGSGDPWTIQR